MPVTRTYFVKDNGAVKRIDSFSPPVVDVSVPGLTGTLLDVETDPNDGDKVFAVGNGNTSLSKFGIYVSSDAGVTWQIPGGNYQTNADGSGILTWKEVFVLDSTNIFVVGYNGYMAVSNDGGLTFNLSTQLSAVVPYTGGAPIIPNVESVHFISPLIGVVGANAYVAITYDGGTTWTYLNGGSEIIGVSGSAMEIVGVHLSADQQTIVAAGKGRVNTSTNAGTSFVETFDWNRSGLHLTWINDLELWGTGRGNLIIKTTDGGLTWTVTQPYNAQGQSRNAAHFYQGQNGFASYGAALESTTDGGLTVSQVVPGSGSAIYAVWTWVAPNNCYLLTACDGSVSPITVDNDLSAFVGQVVKVCPENIVVGNNTTPSGTIFSIPYYEIATAYNLVDCCDPNNVILLEHYNLLPFQQSQGIIELDQIPGKCWTVQKATVIVPPTDLGPAITGYQYANCASCLQDFPCSTPTPPNITECTCFTVSDAPDCAGAITLQNFATPPVFGTCDACISGQPGPCYQLVNCADPSDTQIVSGDLSQYVGGVIVIQGCPNTCWIVQLSDTCVGSIPAPAVLSYNPPTSAPGSKCCYLFPKPSDFKGSITINGTVYPLSSITLVDVVNEISALGLGTCVIQNPGDLSQANSVICIYGTNNYGSIAYNTSTAIANPGCEAVLRFCKYEDFQYGAFTVKVSITINGVLYTSSPILTATGFEIVDYLNSLGLGNFSASFTTSPPNIFCTIYVDGLNTYGPIIIENAFTGAIIDTLSVIECIDYSNTSQACDACSAVPPLPVDLITRSVKPGYNTPGCSPEYTERITCKYGETMFDQMAVERYGITICCDHDVDKWDIQKRILDLKAIYDPAWEKPLTKVCYCYTITQTVDTVTYTYISCEGSLTTVILKEGENVSICSQSYPRACCPPEGAQYTISISHTTCTTNQDCQPSCDCLIVTGISKGLNIFQFQDCATKSIKTITLGLFESVIVCAVPDTFIVIENNPEATINGKCNTEYDCLTCVNITATGSSLYRANVFSFIDCKGNYTEVTLYGEEQSIFCGQPDTLTAISGEVVFQLNGPC